MLKVFKDKTAKNNLQSYEAVGANVFKQDYQLTNGERIRLQLWDPTASKLVTE